MKKAILIGLLVAAIALSGCIQEEAPKEVETSEFKVTAPEGWEIDMNPYEGFLVEFIGPEEDELRASIVITEAVEVESVEAAIQLERSQLIADGFEIVKEKEYLTFGSMVSGRDAHHFFTNYIEKGHKMVGRIIIVSHWSSNKTIRIISFATMNDTDNFSRNGRAFSDVLGRFRWYD